MIIGAESESAKVAGEMVGEYKSGGRVVPVMDKHIQKRAVEVMKEIAKRFRSRKKRKAVPRWSVPGEE